MPEFEEFIELLRMD